MDLAEQLDIDLMDWVNLVSAASESTGINTPERDYLRLRELDEAMAYLTGT